MWTQIKGHYLPIILDFGNAYHLSERKPLGGNPKAIPNHYIPPEHIFGRPDLLNQKTDVWALGALIYQLGTDIRLISSSDRKSSLLRIDDRLAPGWTADLSNEITPSDFWKRTFKRLEKRLKDVGDEDLFKDFLLSMLALDPSNRLSAEDLLSHTYLSEVSLCGATSL
ncbi:hypothetical protein MMC10_010757 [Thelotrema lepadinum]|nr:hypothetical protein [Thelotrema lepadinum]